MSSELEPFVRRALEAGQPRPAITLKLRAAGWREDEIAAALGAFLDDDFPVPVPRRKPYLSAREAFLYLVMFLALYISAFAFGNLLYVFIERGLPDRQLRYYSGGPESVRAATAALIIAFPIFLMLSRHLERQAERDPVKRGSRIRKWLTYITLFVAAGTLIGDLIALVSGLLSGELTARFVLKVATVFFIAGSAFTYYLWELRQDEQETRP